MNHEKEKLLLYALETTYNVRTMDEYRHLLKKKILELHQWNMSHCNN